MTDPTADAAKRTQEQAVAAWVNHLNSLRLGTLFDRLARHEDDLAVALKTVDAALQSIDLEVVARNRGGVKGMHGFIAEVAEVGVSNARARINGGERVYEWVNDNGPVDLLRSGVKIQQKFVAAGGRLGLGAIGEHLDKYPDFIRNGGKYQVPADHYAMIRLLHSMPRTEASRLVSGLGDGPSLRDWERVQAFFSGGGVGIDALEPSALDYADVQRGAYAATLEREKDALRETGRSQRAAASAAARPSLRDGTKATVAAGAVEGATTFVLAIATKRRTGKPLAQFSPKDWREVFGESGVGVVKGGIRGASVYTLTNLAAAPAAVASSLVTASFGIAELANEFRAGALTEVEFIERAELVSLDAAVSAVSSLVGQAVIPIPVLGAVIGNTVGTLMYKTVADSLAQQEAMLLQQYADEQRALGERLSREQALLVEEIRSATSTYVEVLDRAFEPDVKFALAGSISLAKYFGVPASEILDSGVKSAAYFLD
jgi:hypothetical protein